MSSGIDNLINDIPNKNSDTATWVRWIVLLVTVIGGFVATYAAK